MEDKVERIKRAIFVNQIGSINPWFVFRYAGAVI